MEDGGDASGGAPTLAALLDRLLPGTVSVVAAPRGLDVEVAAPVICASDDLGGVLTNDVVLAIGARARDVPELLERAAACDACAVVISADEVAPTAVEAAGSCGVALLLAPRDVSWGRLYALLRSAGPSAAVGVGVPAGDLFRLADAIADMVGGPVTIEDPRSVVLAYSHGSQDVDEPRRKAILGRRVIEEYVRVYRDAGIFRRLAASDEVVRLAGTDELRPRMAVGVHAGGEMLGSIWAAELDAPLGDEAETALRAAARLAALHLLRHRDGDDVERRRRAETVRGVLDGRLPAETAAPALGLAVDESLTVVAFELQAVEGPDAVVLVERLADLVALHAQGSAPGAACAAVGRRVYALLPETGPDAAAARARIRALVPQVLHRVHAALRVDVLAAVGGRARDLGGAATSRWEADQVLRVLVEAADGRGWATVEEERSRVVLLRLMDLAADDDRLLQGPLRVLCEHDADKETSYVETLRAYLDAFGDVAVASRRLCVHPNTFRYRIRRVEELSGLNVGDPEERLVAELQMRLIERRR